MVRADRGGACQQNHFRVVRGRHLTVTVTSLWLNSAGREPVTSFLQDAATPRGFDGKLSGLRIRGKLYLWKARPMGSQSSWNDSGNSRPFLRSQCGEKVCDSCCLVQGPPYWLGLHFWKF